MSGSIHPSELFTPIRSIKTNVSAHLDLGRPAYWRLRSVSLGLKMSLGRWTMPTYVCSVKPDSLNMEEKTRLAKAIALEHSAVTGAPTCLVHVIIEDDKTTKRFVGGKPDEDHVWIVGHIRAGRTREEIGELMLRVMQAVSDVTGIDKHFVWVYINSIASEHMAKYGSVHPAPGLEKEWFAQMPPHVKQWLKDHTVDPRDEDGV